VSAVIGASHVLCSIGSGTDQVWAAARAGIGRIVSSHVMDQHFEPIQMGLVSEDALGELNPEIEKLPLPSRARRMLRLAAPSFQAVAKDISQPVALFLGLPELNDTEAPWLNHFPTYLQKLTGVPLDHGRSIVVPKGRAAALLALERALEVLQGDPSAVLVVGGVDTYLDLRLLATLDAEQRILGLRVMDGVVPGEGAAFFVLRGPASHRKAHGNGIVVNAAASVVDPGHRYGSESARGEGLATALDQVRQRTAQSAGRIATTFAGFNGESFDAKLWGVARLRHSDFFSAGMLIEHPVDKFGDVGAALGSILIAVAAKALESGTRSGPALVWAASDREPRACAVLSVAAH
jgi:3-oxoacyl-[acyl-carrier-protein] synthase I